MKYNLIIKNLNYFILALITIAALNSNAQSALQDVTISNIETSGSGCPDGNARATLAPDKRSMSILFDNFVVQSNGSQPRDILNCDVKVQFSVPKGWKYSIEGIDYRGGVDAKVGSIAKLQLQFYSLNAYKKWKLIDNSLRKFNFKNADIGNYFIHKEIKFSYESLKQCYSQDNTATLLWRTAIAAETISDRDDSYAYVSVDSIDAAQIGQKISLKWSRCN
jgi:hypothetical protein